ncbi:hypothetical protein BYT27DRAFT_7244269 [Phlegmacium glaucopus]|nr:hypothetical protein BYT27DRAFT_7244269 [Phlegmacium glaucopus]
MLFFTMLLFGPLYLRSHQKVVVLQNSSKCIGQFFADLKRDNGSQMLSIPASVNKTPKRPKILQTICNLFKPKSENTGTKKKIGPKGRNYPSSESSPLREHLGVLLRVDRNIYVLVSNDVCEPGDKSSFANERGIRKYTREL